MSERRSNMVPISVIARDICDNFGDSDGKYMGEHLKNIIKTYKELYMFLMNNVSVKSQVMPCDNIIELPCDFVRETKVGIINSDGRIATMSIDGNLRVPIVCKTNTQVSAAIEDAMVAAADSPFFPFYNCFGVDGSYLGEMYGYANSINTLGYFNIDREQNVLIVSPTISSDRFNIVMEYKSDGISKGLELVPTELVNCITDKAKSLFCLDKKDNRYAAFEEYYQLGYKRIKQLYKAKPIDFYAEIFKQSHRSSPK